MPLAVWAIGIACNGAYYSQACNKALEASAKELQIYQTDEKTENYLTVMAKTDADNYLGKSSETVAAGGYFLYKTYKNKAVDTKLPNLGLCDAVKLHAGEDNVNLGLTWRIGK